MGQAPVSPVVSENRLRTGLPDSDPTANLPRSLWVALPPCYHHDRARDEGVEQSGRDGRGFRVAFRALALPFGDGDRAVGAGFESLRPEAPVGPWQVHEGFGRWHPGGQPVRSAAGCAPPRRSPRPSASFRSVSEPSCYHLRVEELAQPTSKPLRTPCPRRSSDGRGRTRTYDPGIMRGGRGSRTLSAEFVFRLLNVHFRAVRTAHHLGRSRPLVLPLCCHPGTPTD